MLKNPVVLLDLVDRLANLMRSEFRRIGGDEGLQPVHIQALMFLEQANRFSNTPQALAEYLGLTKGTVSQSLLLLDRRGLIERYQDEIDKRVVRLRLSSLGEAFLSESAPAALWQTATRDISANRVRFSVSVLRSIVYELQNYNGGPPFGVCSTCIYCQRKSQRIHHCTWFGERLSGPETRKICREQVPKTGYLSVAE
ncbi:MAG: MarR family winged helix-turn-helix transcriptional regulator [Burkholderiales bacterium]